MLGNLRFLMRLLTILPLLFVDAGCAKFANRKPTNYETVKATPNRDTSKAKLLNAEALELLDVGNTAKAEAKLKEALVADVDFGPAHNTLGYIYYRSKRYYLAAWEFQHAIKTMGHLARPHYNLGMVYEAVDRLDDAIASYSTAYEIAPEDPLVIGNLARATMKRNEHDPLLAHLMEELLLHDTRNDWRIWAREKLHTGKLPTNKSWETIESTDEPNPQGEHYEELPPNPTFLPLSEPAIDIQASFEQAEARRLPRRLPAIR
ncbi:MAG: tetratricopeptide repeat protein [Planctomycetales bacterium]|nr:tetratricopeptide repeat protein [Planctomycetales bacterium]